MIIGQAIHRFRFLEGFFRLIPFIDIVMDFTADLFGFGLHQIALMLILHRAHALQGHIQGIKSFVKILALRQDVRLQEQDSRLPIGIDGCR